MSGAEQPPVESASEGKYVYCIIETSEPRSFGPMGIGGRKDEVYTVHHKGLAAVVSNSPLVVLPSATTHAPVNVATSTMRSGFTSTCGRRSSSTRVCHPTTPGAKRDASSAT